jgi:hypothetical protein
MTFGSGRDAYGLRLDLCRPLSKMVFSQRSSTDRDSVTRIKANTSCNAPKEHGTSGISHAKTDPGNLPPRLYTFEAQISIVA